MSAVANKLRRELLGDLLKQVSRSFHLSLRFLPMEVCSPISLAYLLARTSDTVADTECLPAGERLAALEEFAQRISGASRSPLAFKQFIGNQGNPSEARLLERAEDSLSLLEASKESDRTLIRQVLGTIISGQALDLNRFAEGTESNIAALTTPDELDDYTYRVAGCVGEFWTRICHCNLSPYCMLTEAQMIELGIRFGKGLQLINILRDLPRDLRQGRCYLPTDQLARSSLTPADLLTPTNEPRVRPVYNEWLERAHQFLLDGWTYTNAYPRSMARIRISCALPVLIGLRTIQQLRTGRVLDPATRLKVPRNEVKRLVLQAFLRHPFDHLWKGLGRESEKAAG